ncbi:ABC transporter substrate-binding protein [Mammaliicoccus sciuri]|uniref:ABC transporter substrate-binding protein n=1 Tax=Mammaliicoccus sciuri TaxID=1296 RepID=UPI000D1E4C9E|nr:sugar ABC transporter substrate-binding protein [Mammaliicoccus sciuri]PTJ45058.1 sugar ABC transporter substrate-binding protein [Mammaliicoccus sciuri]RIO17391.1 sugar ABC transporter substrate-binding protein [Mammaliicoccus sciuri]
MNKKIVTILIVATLLLSSCAQGNIKKGNSNDKHTITIAVTEGNIGQFNAWEARSKEFTKETGIKVRFVGVPYENLLNRITTEGISEEPSFDLVTYADVMGPSIKQFLQPLDGYTDKKFFDRFPESTMNLSTYDNKIYSLPLRANTQLLFYRKDIFKKLNIEPPKTWEDLNKASAKIKKETGKYGITPYYQSGNNGQNLYMWTSYLWGNDGDIFDKNMKPIFNNKKGVEATKEYIDLIRKDRAPKGSVQFGEQDSRTHFKQGRSAMWLGWWWVYSDFNGADSAKEVQNNVGFVPVPTWKGGDKVSSISTFPLGMMKDSKNKKDAWKFMKWLSEEENEKSIVKDSLTKKSPPEQFSTDIVQKKNLRNKELNDLGDNLFNIAGDSFEEADTLPTSRIWPRVSDILSREISNMATGDDVEKSLDKAADDVEKLLDSEGYYDK